ncbi:MAG: EutN/CcmL family microcompartment protein [Pirellulales bacterium]|nr:EutN/CcmL family microcompartment protein [Pirellulales bacterium]
MQLGRVVGTAISTVKHRTMQGWKLLVVQPLRADGQSPDGDPQLAIDTLGAGRAELVLLSNDGKSARDLIGDPTSPVRWTVLGIVDGR